MCAGLVMLAIATDAEMLGLAHVGRVQALFIRLRAISFYIASSPARAAPRRHLCLARQPALLAHKQPASDTALCTLSSDTSLISHLERPERVHQRGARALPGSQLECAASASAERGSVTCP